MSLCLLVSSHTPSKECHSPCHHLFCTVPFLLLPVLAASVEEAGKPVPKAHRSKALERLSQSDKVSRATEEVPVTPPAGLRSPDVKSDSGNLRRPMNLSPRSASVERRFDKHRADDASLTSSDSDSQGSGDGKLFQTPGSHK